MHINLKITFEFQLLLYFTYTNTNIINIKITMLTCTQSTYQLIIYKPFPIYSFVRNFNKQKNSH